MKPSVHSAGYLAWPTLPKLFPFSVSGVQTKRDDSLIDFDREQLWERMTVYFNADSPESELRATVPLLMRDSNRFDHKAVRRTLVKRGMLAANVVPYLYRPFDLRWVYWEPDTKLLGEKSPDYFPQLFTSNYWLLTTGRTRKGVPEPPIAATRLADLNLMDSGLRATPLLLRQVDGSMDGVASTGHPNLSEHATAYLKKLQASHEDLLFHSLAVMHSVAYREANAGALRQEWPRIPLPAQLYVLRASAELGREITALLDTETRVAGVTSGTPRLELKTIAAVERLDGQPLAAADFALTAGWGSVGPGGVTMPRTGSLDKRTTSPGEAASGFGTATYDIFLNAKACWRHVPPDVWNYTLGGYQVLKKWLSYREQTLLGRALTLDEVKTFTAIARRIAALLSLRDRLDANYHAVSSNTVAFKSKP